MKKNSPYKQALETARAEHKELMKQQIEIQARMLHLRTVFYSLGALSESWAKLGLTEAIKGVAESSEHGLSPVEIKDKLQAASFPVDKYKNPLATIHTVVKRLVDSGDMLLTSDGRYYYPGAYLGYMGESLPAEVVMAYHNFLRVYQNAVAHSSDEPPEQKKGGKKK